MLNFGYIHRFILKKFPRVALKSYLCSELRNEKVNKRFNRHSETRSDTKDAKTMEKNKMIVMLKYRIKRYQAMGNGTMCQNLISELNRLQSNAQTSEARVA